MEENTEISKLKAEIDAVICERLFEASRWLADDVVGFRLMKKMDRWGLNTYRFDKERQVELIEPTPLGQVLEAELISVFLGLISDLELLFILEEHGLIGQSDISLISEQLTKLPPSANEKYFMARMETFLRPLVQHAYRQWNYLE